MDILANRANINWPILNLNVKICFNFL
jgi:hypothetical protein